MPPETTFDEDLAEEHELALFLDKYLYNTDFFEDFHRTNDYRSQQAGIDNICSISKLGLKNIKIDEKAQLDYINNPLDTFVLELFYNTSSLVKFGWFLDFSKKTTHYLFIWINNANNTKNNSCNDYNIINFCLVKKNNLKNFFNKEGYTNSVLAQKGWEIIKARQYKKSKIEGKNDYWFFYSYSNKGEGPINLVVRKSILLQFADFNGIIYRNSNDESFTTEIFDKTNNLIFKNIKQ